MLDIAEANFAVADAEVQPSLGAARPRSARPFLYEIVAPFRGVVGLASVDEGALVGPESPPFVTLVRRDPMYVEFPVPERTLLEFQARRAAGTASPIGAVTLVLADGSTYPHPGDIDFSGVTVAQRHRHRAGPRRLPQSRSAA